ncbi:hypothetical protein PR002_g18156 [Phytophthora rubi]|uniref:Aspartate aminotransferase n=1 Tax=Phytophthora rubi TaxID=129364 RepID=A0A6A3K4S0_9STRA|nr:hypothetical protein PR002_g18156 [Phytophthora rubi]
MKGEVKVAYQGMPGAYSEKATRQLLGSSANVVAVGYPSFDEAFQAVQREDADFGVLPIENSLGGSIHANYDLLLKFGLHIVGEYDLRVEHSLLALPGVRKSDIKTVISHPQALAQCAHTIASMGAKPRAEYDTAGSAKMLADNQWRDTAAVASDLAAEYYGLQVLQRNVEDDAGNFTRFLLLSKKEDLGLDAKAGTEFKTSLVFSFVDSNEKGQLYKALSAFSLRDIDMSKIESRPWGHTAEQQFQDSAAASSAVDFSLSGESARRKYSYLFYVDLIGHQTDENVINALRHLREFCKFVRVLGSYPTKGKLLGDVRKTLEAVGAYQANPVTASPAVAPQPKPVRLNIGIYGFGNFGQFLAKTMAKAHDVRATSRTDYSAVAAQLGCTYYSSETQLQQFFEGLDVLVLGVSILSFEGVLSKIPKHLLENLVIVDVLSVKTHPKQIMLKNLPESASILCTHPMFGPESGKYSWRGLPMMYEKVRIVSGEHNHVMDNFLRIFETELCRMLEMTCESHDEYAASSQFLTHLTGRILSVQGVKNTPIDTRGFKNLVRLVEDTCKDSFDLFQGLYKFNPNSEQQIQKFRESLNEVTQKLGNKPTTTTSSFREDAPMTEKYPQNPLLGKIAASKTVVIHGMAKQLEAEGKQVWSLCVGEPDFAPAERVLKAGMSAMQQGKVKYTDVKGTADLRTLIAQYLETCKGLKYDPRTEILVSNGAKQTVYQALLTITKPGEQVLIPAPYWVSYPEMVKLTGGEPVILQTKLSEHYLIDPVELEKALVANPRVKSLMLCNPSNPAGTVHSPAQLERIAAVLRKPQFRHILVIADEIYEQLVYQDEGEAKREHQSFATLPGMYERTLTVNGFSKSHAMPGLRIGYLAAPKYFTQVCTKLQGQLTSCANSVGQAAAVEAMKFEMECVSQNQERMTETLAIMDEKRKYIVKRLQAIPQLEFAYPTSAFYVFMDLASYFEGKQGVTADKSEVVKDADDYCEYLLRHYHVALVPGSAFGVKNGLRISYACSMETIKHALDGLEQSLSGLTFTPVSGGAVAPAVAAPAVSGGAAITRAPFREDAPMTEKYPQNPLLGKIAASKTVVIHGMAKQLEAEGKQVWSLCVGEPDFAPAERVLKAGMSAMQQGKVKYTDVKGTADLRTLIAQYLETCKGLKYDPRTEILVSNGAKQTVYQALLTITKPGEQVLIPAPYWVSYPEMVKLTGGEPVILQTKLSEHYLIDPVELEKALVANPRVKSLMLCNPSNPAGTVHSPAQLERIAAVLRKPQFRHILVIADEIYEQLVYQDEGEAKREHQSFATLPGMYERTLTVNGFSKSHAMPGLRIGYLAAPKYFTQVCTKLQGQLTSCANSVGQAAAVEAMKFEMECVSQNQERMTETLAIMDEKRKYIVKRLQAIPQLEFAYPTSAFYVFMDLASYFEGKQGVTADKSEVVKDADDYCEYLLRHYHVALVPGSAFGVKNGLRISYACSMETIKHALDGLEQSLNALTFD